MSVPSIEPEKEVVEVREVTEESNVSREAVVQKVSSTMSSNMGFLPIISGQYVSSVIQNNLFVLLISKSFVRA